MTWIDSPNQGRGHKNGSKRGHDLKNLVVSNMFYVHPYLQKIPILANIFQLGWFSHHLDWVSPLKTTQVVDIPLARGGTPELLLSGCRPLVDCVAPMVDLCQFDVLLGGDDKGKKTKLNLIVQYVKGAHCWRGF